MDGGIVMESNPIELAWDACRAWKKENSTKLPVRVYLNVDFYYMYLRAHSNRDALLDLMPQSDSGELEMFGAPCFIIADERHPSIVIA